MRTSVAQRTGIVASVIWFFVGFSWSYLHETNAASELAVLRPQLCEQRRDQEQSWTKPDHCWDTYTKDFREIAPHPAANGLFVGLAPIPLAWLLALIFVRTARWVMYGRWKRRRDD